MTFKPIFRLLCVATVDAEFKLSCSAKCILEADISRDYRWFKSNLMLGTLGVLSDSWIMRTLICSLDIWYSKRTQWIFLMEKVSAGVVIYGGIATKEFRVCNKVKWGQFSFLLKENI